MPFDPGNSWVSNLLLQGNAYPGCPGHANHAPGRGSRTRGSSSTFRWPTQGRNRPENVHGPLRVAERQTCHGRSTLAFGGPRSTKGTGSDAEVRLHRGFRCSCHPGLYAQFQRCLGHRAMAPALVCWTKRSSEVDCHAGYLHPIKHVAGPGPECPTAPFILRRAAGTVNV